MESWQDLLAIFIALGAAVYVGYAFVRKMSRKNCGCDGCAKSHSSRIHITPTRPSGSARPPKNV